MTALVSVAMLSGAGGRDHAVSALADGQAGTAVERRFEVLYHVWRHWVDDLDHGGLEFSSASQDWLYDNEPYRQLIALGPPSLPCLVAHLREDSTLEDAIGRIAGVTLHVHRTALAPGHSLWTIDELPGYQQADRAPDPADVWLRWWNVERFHTPERFEKLDAERQALLQQGDAKGAQEKYERIQNLGIAVLPCLRDKIGQGATDLVPIMSALTNGAVKPDASPADCAKWWNAHKQEWTLPAATATDKAK
jgi:hypothetical protein